MTLYVSAAEFKSEYKNITGGTDDTFIARALQAAQDALDAYLRRTVLADQDTTHYFDIGGESIEGLVLYASDAGDLCSITTVTNGDGVEVTSSQYTTYPKTLTTYAPTIEQIRILLQSGVTWDYSTDYENAVAITGKWGMWSDADDVPEAFKVSVMELTAHMMETRKAQVFDTVAVPDAGIITVPSGWPATVRARLAPWRRLIA